MTASDRNGPFPHSFVDVNLPEYRKMGVLLMAWQLKCIVRQLHPYAKELLPHRVSQP